MSNNAPVVPQARSIEKFWALGNSEFKKRSIPVQSIDEMQKVWLKISNKAARKSGKLFMMNVKSKLKNISDNNVCSFVN